MDLFGGTHKTVAIGVPLINAIYEGSPYIGVYTLPLLIWHPMQLVVGTLLATPTGEMGGRRTGTFGHCGREGR
jgi:sodium/bile acid cotransporter 7